jgi:hypothetical protein
MLRTAILAAMIGTLLMTTGGMNRSEALVDGCCPPSRAPVATYPRRTWAALAGRLPRRSRGSLRRVTSTFQEESFGVGRLD